MNCIVMHSSSDVCTFHTDNCLKRRRIYVKQYIAWVRKAQDPKILRYLEINERTKWLIEPED
jgi:hypothetical protein